MASPRPAVQYVYISGDLPEGTGHLALGGVDLEEVQGFLGDLELGPEYYVLYRSVPLGTRVKGGPGDAPVRTPSTKVLRRYQQNARFRRVAQATYPGVPADEAVRRWYVYGGSTQVLRWSDAQVSGYIRALGDERQRGRPTAGDYYLYLGTPDRSAARRRERGAPGTEKRASYNARRNASRRAARARQSAARRAQREPVAPSILQTLGEAFGLIEEGIEQIGGYWT